MTKPTNPLHNLTPVAEDTIKQMQEAFKASTRPKIRADIKRNARNVALARTRIAI